MEQFKIKGAGMAGLSSAVYLGNKASVFERRQTVGSFFEVDIHSFKNYGYPRDILEVLTEMGIALKDYHPVNNLYHVAPNGAKYRIDSENRPLFYNVARGTRSDSIDNLLFNQAYNQGAEFHFGSEKNDGFDIIACGSSRSEVVGYGKHFKNVYSKDIYIFQDEEIAPKGYIYFCPYKNNEATLVAVAFKQPKGFNIKTAFESFATKNPVAKELIRGGVKICEVSGFGSYNLPRNAKRGNTLYSGESAGFGDAGRGFGMYYAISSGYLAAKAIDQKLDYNRLWKQAFGKELFERYARRIYLNTLGNSDHNRMIENTIKLYGTEIPITVYQNRKKTAAYKKFLLETYARYKLISHRRNFPLE